jgi:Raf kinase inhibitor-like YbhB/YbcL family protein
MSALSLTSSSFAHEGEIPPRHTCAGADQSPALSWSGVPAGTKSLALIVDDPDAPDPKAPRMTWVHWVLYDIPATVTSLPEGVDPTSIGAREGLNDWRASGYRGPAPPVGRHRYFHKLYALDAVLADLGRADKAALERAMHGHILGHATLVGTFAKG